MNVSMKKTTECIENKATSTTETDAASGHLLLEKLSKDLKSVEEVQQSCLAKCQAMALFFGEDAGTETNDTKNTAYISNMLEVLASFILSFGAAKKKITEANLRRQRAASAKKG